KLDLQIHDALHLRRARIADDRSMAERARPELHASEEESDDFLVGKKFGDFRRALFVVGDERVRVSMRIEIRTNLLVGKRRPQVRADHRIGGIRVPLLTVDLEPRMKSTSERATGITCRWLHPDVLEWALAKEMAIRDAIECDASGETD